MSYPRLIWVAPSWKRFFYLKPHFRLFLRLPLASQGFLLCRSVLLLTDSHGLFQAFIQWGIWQKTMWAKEKWGNKEDWEKQEFSHSTPLFFLCLLHWHSFLVLSARPTDQGPGTGCEHHWSCNCVFQAEQDLQKLTVDANRSRQTLEEQMVEFERKKTEDIRVWIKGEFTLVHFILYCWLFYSQYSLVLRQLGFLNSAPRGSLFYGFMDMWYPKIGTTF